MTRTTALITLASLLAAGSLAATCLHDSAGRTVVVEQVGKTTYYRFADGTVIRAETSGGTTYYRDSSGRALYRSETSGGTTYYRDSAGKTIGQTQTSGGTTYYRGRGENLRAETTGATTYLRGDGLVIICERGSYRLQDGTVLQRSVVGNRTRYCLNGHEIATEVGGILIRTGGH